MTHDEWHLIYTSRLAPGCGHEVYGPICQSSRSNNIERGIGGVLLFDGQRFAHWLYGSRESVTALMRAIEVDPRHEALSVHVQGGAPQALPPSALLVSALLVSAPIGSSDRTWRSGFVDAQAMDALIASLGGGAQAVAQGLQRAIGAADLDPPLRVGSSRGQRSTPD